MKSGLKGFYDSYSQSPKPTSITLTFEDIQGTSIDLSIEMSEHVQLVQKRGRKYQRQKTDLGA